jgi:hypothetical protein
MRILVGLLLIVFCFGSNSCQKELDIKDLDSNIVTHPVTGSFKAKIDGVQFIADKFTGITRALNTIAIGGQGSDGQQIILRVADSGVHVYTLDINSFTNAGAYSEDNDIAYSTNGGSTSAESGGTLSITSIDEVNKTMSGTFSITVFRQTDGTQKVITEGVFTNIAYTTTAIPPANSTDTFSVKVDGEDFPEYSILATSVFNMISISASDQDVSKTVGLSFPSDVTAGVYTFDPFGFEYIGQYNVGASFLIANSGTLTILEHNTATKRIRGTFEFPAEELSGTGSAELTEGYFSVIYQ